MVARGCLTYPHQRDKVVGDVLQGLRLGLEGGDEGGLAAVAGAAAQSRSVHELLEIAEVRGFGGAVVRCAEEELDGLGVNSCCFTVVKETSDSLRSCRDSENGRD